MKKWSVQLTNGEYEQVEADSCTPTSNGELVFMVLDSAATPPKAGMSRIYASGMWRTVEAASSPLIALPSSPIIN